MEFLSEYFQQSSQTRPADLSGFRCNRKFDTALFYDRVHRGCSFFKSDPEALEASDKEIYRDFVKLEDKMKASFTSALTAHKTDLSEFPPLYLIPFLQEHCYNHDFDPENQSEAMFNLGLDLLTIQEDWLFSSASQRMKDLKTFTRKFEYTCHLPSFVKSLLSLGFELDVMVREIHDFFNIDRNKGKVFTKRLEKQLISMWATQTTFCIRIGTNNILICPYHQLAMMSNKLLECGLGMMYIYKEEGHQFTEGIYRRALKVIKMVWLKFESLNTKVFDLLKVLEALCIAIIVERNEDWVNTYLMDNLWQQIKADRLLSGTPQDNSLLMILKECSDNELIEICSLSKWFGHPTIEFERGLTKLYDRTHREIIIPQENVDAIVRESKKHFLVNYRKKHGKYPLVEIDPQCPMRLQLPLLHNRPFYNADAVQRNQVPLDVDFDWIELTKIMEFDRVDDLLPVLKDKALAPMRRQIAAVINGSTHLAASERRAILHFLISNDPFTKVSTYMMKYSEDPHTVLDYLVIKLTAKEKELKREGRFFGQSPFEERARRTILEHNMARFMSKYDDDEAMTLSEIEKFKRLHAFGVLKKVVHDSCVIQVSFDAVAWNNSFRSNLVNQYGEKIMDKIMGCNEFCRTMDVYELSTIYHVSPLLNYRGWEGQLGGIEGLSQKVWTMVYKSIARQVLDDLNLRGFIMVNGDDLRGAIVIPNQFFEGRTKQDAVLDLLDQMKDRFQMYGPVIKIEETMASEKVIAFGRLYQIDEVCLPSVMKKLVKSHGFANTILPFTGDLIGNVFSNCHSSCTSGYSHRLAYIIACMLTLFHLSYAEREEFQKLSKIEQKTLCLIPSCVGGFPVLLYNHFLVQGQSDMLCDFLSLGKYIYTNHPEFRVCLEKVWCHRSLRPNPAQIVSDPYGLPLEIPTSGFSYLKRLMENKLFDITSNKALKQVLKMASNKNKRAFLKVLYSIEPFFPRLLSSLYQVSIFAIVDQVLTKFDSSQSVTTYLLMGRKKAEVAKIMARSFQIEKERVLTIMKMVNREKMNQKIYSTLTIPEFLSQCPTKSADQIRECLWRRPVEGITYPSFVDQVGHILPEEDGAIEYINDHFETLFVRVIDSTRLPYLPHDQFSKPTFSPFFGASTGKRIQAPRVEISMLSSTADKIKSLITLYTMVSPSSPELIPIMNWVCESMTGKTISVLCPYQPVKLGGTLTHRLGGAHFERQVKPNERFSLSAMVRTQVDTNRAVHATQKNYTINFLYLKCMQQKLLLYPLEMNPRLQETHPTIVWHYLKDCRYCTKEVNEPPFTCNMISELPWVECQYNNPLLTLGESALAEIQNHIDRLSAEHAEYDYQIVDATHGVTPETEMVAHFVTAYHCIGTNDFDAARINYDKKLNMEAYIQFETLDDLVTSNINRAVSIKDVKAIQSCYLLSLLLHMALYWVIQIGLTVGVHDSRSLVILPTELLPFRNICYWMLASHKVGNLEYCISKEFIWRSTLGFESRRSVAGLQNALWRALAPLVCEILDGKRPLEACPIIASKYETDEWLYRQISYIQVACTYRAAVGLKNLGLNVWKISHFHIRNTDVIVNSELVALYITTMYRARKREKDITFTGPQTWIEVFINQDFWDTETVIVEDDIPSWLRSVITKENVDIEGMLEKFNRMIQRGLAGMIVHPDLQDHLEIILSHMTSVRVIVNCMDQASASAITRTTAEENIFEQSLEQPIDSIEKIFLNFKPPMIPHNAPQTTLSLTHVLTHPLSQRIYTLADTLADEFPNVERLRPPQCTFLLRGSGVQTTAWAKYAQIIGKVRVYSWEKSEFVIICTADGSGGLTRHFLNYFQRCKVVFNTLYEPHNATVEILYPEELDSMSIDKCARVDARANYTSENDLTKITAINMIIARLQHSYGKYTLARLITCDAEGINIEENIVYYQILINLTILAIRRLEKDGLYIQKTFLSTSYRFLVWFYSLGYLFTQVSIQKPRSSHCISGEIFVVCSGLKIDGDRKLTEQQWLKFIQAPKGENNDFLQYIALEIRKWFTRRERAYQGEDVLRYNQILRDLDNLAELNQPLCNRLVQSRAGIMMQMTRPIFSYGFNESDDLEMIVDEELNSAIVALNRPRPKITQRTTRAVYNGTIRRFILALGFRQTVDIMTKCRSPQNMQELLLHMFQIARRNTIQKLYNVKYIRNHILLSDEGVLFYNDTLDTIAKVDEQLIYGLNLGCQYWAARYIHQRQSNPYGALY